MPDHEHELWYRIGLPKKATERQVADVRECVIQVFKNMAGPYARNLRFRYMVKDVVTRVGGPTGFDTTVRYLQVCCQFSGLPSAEVHALKKEAESGELDRIVREHASVH
jgi:hypothetical protein